MAKKTKKSKKKVAAVQEDAGDWPEKLAAAEARIAVLESQLLARSQDVSILQGALKDLQASLAAQRAATDGERADRFDLAADAARQMKSMQTDLLDKVKKAEQDKATAIASAKEERDRMAAVVKEREGTIEQQRAEINQLKQQMSELSAEFSGVLRETLNSIADRVGDSVQNKPE